MAPMTRVGFIIPERGEAWLGGDNYVRNLLLALAAAEEQRIEPVVVVARSNRHGAERYPGARIVRSSALNRRGLFRLARSGARGGLGVDVLAEYLAKRWGLALFSHVLTPSRFAGTPILSWIPDFQHLHLPEFFSAEELAARDAAFCRAANRATRVVVSSEAARQDFVRCFPFAEARCDVLRFVASTDAISPTSRRALESTYGFSGPFFFLPGQFWQHKNHAIVLEALATLAGRGAHALVLATGSTEDYRCAGHFRDLMRRCRAVGMEHAFRPLGVVPYADVVGLMRHSLAVLQPSLFEGWSTTVEEAKSMGKRILLSDIPVHREQAPARGAFFDPRDATALADAVQALTEDYRSDDEAEWAARAAADLLVRREDYARRYADIVARALAAP